MLKPSFQSLLILLLFTASSVASFGQDISWTGTGTNGLWSNPANWNRARVPDVSDIVEIGNSNTMTLTESGITIKGLVIRANGSLILDHPDARINIIDSPAEGIKFILKGKLTINQGTISISNPETDGILVDDQSVIVNRGTLLINNFGEDGLHIKDNSTLENYGEIAIDQLNGSTPELGINAEDGTFTNYNGGQVFVSTCLSPSPMISMLNIADNFLYEDNGESFFFPRNCN